MSGVKPCARVEVKVTPRAKSNRWEWRGDRLHLYVTAQPVEGKANEECIRMLSNALGISQRSIRLLCGAKSREKMFIIEGMALDEVKKILCRIIDEIT